MRRDAFVIDNPDLCYMDGNSLGRMPKLAAERLHAVMHEEWGKQLIGGWNAGWIDLPERLGTKIAQVVGARSNEVVVTDSTSVNLFKLATAALGLRQDRKCIVTDATNFPSDLYILESAIKAAGAGHELMLVGGPDQVTVPTETIISHIDSSTALVCLSQVTFKSGQLHDLAAITEAAHAAGALVLWDLSHSVGAVPIDLATSRVDLAVGCTYKYLCGGPGAPAFLYCREDLQHLLENPIAGWFSHRVPFEFSPEYEACEGVGKFLVGTPPILSMAAIEAGVDMVIEVGMDTLRSRSKALSERLLGSLADQMSELGFELRSPALANERGSHLSIGHPEARRITENLIQRHQVVPDFRAPDNIRLGIAPLYTSESEIDHCVEALLSTVKNQEYQSVQLPPTKVT